MHDRVRSLNSVWIVYWILLSVSRSTDALYESSVISLGLLNVLSIHSRGFIENYGSTIFHQSPCQAKKRPFSDAQIAPSLSITVSKEWRLTGVVVQESLMESIPSARSPSPTVSGSKGFSDVSTRYARRRASQR
jgi:hypothetical protein